MQQIGNAASRKTVVAFAFPFRIFFLSTGVAGALLIPLWLYVLFGHGAVPLALPPVAWHLHEMLVGFVNAAIAGFLLTAVCNWTGTAPLSGKTLAALWGVWLAGRLLMLFGAGLGPWPMVVDVAFLPLVALDAGRRVIRARQPRQFPILLILALLWLLDLGFLVSGELRFMRALEVLVATLILVIGGRITPAFTRGWLARHGGPADRVRQFLWLDRTVLASGLLLAVMQVLIPASAWRAPVALAAALAAGWRLWLWRGWLARREPLLWILHLGVLWVVIGFFLNGLSASGLVAPTAWEHALGAGAIATMILGVMTRVALGHTGRPLRLPRGAVWIYGLILLAGMARLLTALDLLPWQPGVLTAGAAWTLAFLLFCVLYFPILLRPRTDGRPG